MSAENTGKGQQATANAEGKGNSLVALALFAVLALGALALGVYFRTPMLHFSGFYEPDGFYHYSMVRSAVLHSFVIPEYMKLSGWPEPAFAGKQHAELYSVTLIPYFFLQYVGVSYYAIMRLIPLVYGILDAIGAYLLSRYLSKDKLFGVLVILFVSLSIGNAARTSALIYRGDSFVSVFLLGALICAIEALSSSGRNRKLLFMVLAGMFLSITNAVWNGAPFATVIFIVLFLFLLLFGFVFEDRKMLDESKYLLGVFAVWYALVNAYMFAGIMFPGQAFTGIDFIAIFALMLVGWYLINQIIKNRGVFTFLGSTIGRAVAFVLLFVLAVAVVYVIIPNFFYDIFIGGNYLITSNFSATIQELQPPTPSFLWASFSAQEFLSPMGYSLMASAYVQTWQVPPDSALTLWFQKEAHFIFWIALLALFAPYFFMQVEYDGETPASGEKYKMPVLAAACVLLALAAGLAALGHINVGFVLAALAIGAGCVLGLGCSSPRLKFGFNVGLLALVAYMAITAYLQMTTIRFNSLISIPLAIFAAYTVYWLITCTKRYLVLYIIAFVLLGALVAYMLLIDSVYIQGLSPADGINSQFISAMSWLKNNSASNSVVLALWPDGSVVEGIANRTSVTDSVGSQNSTKANAFAAWLFNSSPDPQFLLSSINGKPNYFVVRSVWMLETGGIFTEAGINSTTVQNYGYSAFPEFNERANGTSQALSFSGLGNITEQTIVSRVNGSNVVQSYLASGSRISPMRDVAFYDIMTGNYMLVKQTAYNFTNNQTFLVEYSSVPNPKLPVNVTGGIIFNQGIAESNLMKFMYFCNQYQCPWDNNVAKLQLVYYNGDTKIFKIVYNTTAS